MEHGYHAMLFVKYFELEYVGPSVCGLSTVENSVVSTVGEETYGACRSFGQLGCGLRVHAVAMKRTTEADTN
jgi:hypothetical protein